MIPAVTSSSVEGIVLAFNSLIVICLLYFAISSNVGLKLASDLSSIRPAAARTFNALPPFVKSSGIAIVSPSLISSTDLTLFE